MNPPNPSKDAPLSNKLILLMLTGIFVCLVMLVIRAFDRPNAVAPNVAVTVTTAPEAEPAPQAVAIVSSQPVARRPVAGAPSVPVVPVPAQQIPTEPTQETPVTVSQTVFLPPGSGPRGGSASGRAAGSVQMVGGPAATDSSITGTITLLGTPKPEIPINFGASCGKFAPPATTRHYVVGSNAGLANVFVYVVDAKRVPVTGPGPLIDQIGCMFEPYVTGVGVNQPFAIRNSDPEMHNVHASPRNPQNKEFNFAQMTGPSVKLVSFAYPEVLIRLKCDVHPWMFAYVGVVDHPWFAISDSDGTYQIPQGIPAGRYRLSAVHLKAGIQTQDIIVKSGQPTVVNFTFAVPGNATPQTTQVPYATR